MEKTSLEYDEGVICLGLSEHFANIAKMSIKQRVLLSSNFANIAKMNIKERVIFQVGNITINIKSWVYENQ